MTGRRVKITRVAGTPPTQERAPDEFPEHAGVYLPPGAVSETQQDPMEVLYGAGPGNVFVAPNSAPPPGCDRLTRLTADPARPELRASSARVTADYDYAERVYLVTVRMFDYGYTVRIPEEDMRTQHMLQWTDMLTDGMARQIRDDLRRTVTDVLRSVGRR